MVAKSVVIHLVATCGKNARCFSLYGLGFMAVYQDIYLDRRWRLGVWTVLSGRMDTHD
jgi:hypothetical protein